MSDIPQAQPPPPSLHQPNGQRIEAIKQYYNQLCTNLRHIVNQLNAPDVTAQRKIVLQQQQEQVQKSLQEFTEKVLRPLASAATAGGHNGGPNPIQHIQQQQQQPQQSQSQQMNLNQRSTNSFPGASPLSMSTSTASIPPKATSPVASNNPPSGPPPPIMPPAPPMLFQHAPLAIRQALVAIQKQAQQIQHQQAIFQQKVMSRSFDSSLAQAHRQQQKPPEAKVTTVKSGCQLVAPIKTPSTDNLMESSAARGKTVQELLDEIGVKAKCGADLEDALLRIADDFVDQVGSFAAQLASHRKDIKMTKKDMELAVERLHSIVLPGSYRSTILSASVKKLSAKKTSGGSTTNPHLTRMAQLKKHFASRSSL